MRPEFDYGDAVRVTRNLRNDGTFPGQDRGDLLIRRGSTGYVRDVGRFLQDTWIYAVAFPEAGRVIGCRGEELQSAAAPWTPSRFENRETVAARLMLSLPDGVTRLEPGTEGQIVGVLRDESSEVMYHVHFPGHPTLRVPESALDPPATPHPRPS